MKKEEEIISKKIELFEKVKSNGFLWSYDKGVQFKDFPEKIFIEHTLKFADIPELCVLFRLYDLSYLKMIWKEMVAWDTSFLKTNVMLGKLFFDLDCDASYFTSFKNPRYERLKLLAERD